MTDTLLDTERDALNRFSEAKAIDELGSSPSGAALETLLLRCGLESIRIARSRKLGERDGTRPTARVVAKEIKEVLQTLVVESGLSASFLAEGLGEDYELKGRTVAVDPMDGELAFINHAANFATSIAFFTDKKIEAALLANPSTGELIYTAEGQVRLLQLGAGGCEPCATALPLSGQREGTVLLNISSSQSAGPLTAAAMTAWADSSLHLVTMNGGSPAWALAECAKGLSAYVNLWATSETFPFELAAGVELVRKAGGEVVDASGAAIDALTHRGPFVASTSDDVRSQVLKTLRTELRNFADSVRKDW